MVTSSCLDSFIDCSAEAAAAAPAAAAAETSAAPAVNIS